MIIDYKKYGVDHIGIVVKDLMKAVKLAYDLFGVGPWKLFKLRDDVPTWKYGKQVKSEQLMAFAYINDVKLELIQPMDGSETYMYDDFQKYGNSVSHMGLVCKDREQMEQVAEMLRKEGFKEVHYSENIGIHNDGNNYHFDTREVFGMCLEVCEPIDVPPEPFGCYPEGSIDLTNLKGF